MPIQTKATYSITSTVAAGSLPLTGGTLTGGLTGTTIANTGNHTITSGNLVLATIGNGIVIKSGLNARVGTALLNGTTEVIISNTTITPNSLILLTINFVGGTPGSPYVSSRTSTVNFGIKSTGASDSSTVAWVIIESS